jgi:hypothetical protein
LIIIFFCATVVCLLLSSWFFLFSSFASQLKTYFSDLVALGEEEDDDEDDDDDNDVNETHERLATMLHIEICPYSQQQHNDSLSNEKKHVKRQKVVSDKLASTSVKSDNDNNETDVDFNLDDEEEGNASEHKNDDENNDDDYNDEDCERMHVCLEMFMHTSNCSLPTDAALRSSHCTRVSPPLDSEMCFNLRLARQDLLWYVPLL